MQWLSSLMLILSIYTVYYTVMFVHKPVVYSKNKRVVELASKIVCPLFLLPSGIPNSIYQIVRKIEVSKHSVRKHVILEVEENVRILIEIFEPVPFKVRKRSRTINFLDLIFQGPFRQFLLIFHITFLITKSLINLLLILFRIKGFSKVIDKGMIKRMVEIKKKNVNDIKSNKDASRDNCNDISNISNNDIKSNKDANNIITNKIIDINNKLIDINNKLIDTNNNKDINKLIESKSLIKDNVLLVHGLNGSSRSTYIKGMANVFLEKQCRVFCFNVRGAIIPTTSNTFNHIGLISDIKKTVDYILENYSGQLVLVGFSMGANWISNYLGTYFINNPRIKMGISICCPFDFLNLKNHFKNNFFGKLLNSFMTLNYKRYINRSLIKPVDLTHCKNLEEIDTELLANYLKSASLDQFYSESSCVGVIHNISVPTLFLCAIDDPLIPQCIIPFEKFEKNENLSFIILRGGHLGFFANGLKTNAEILVEKYYDIISS